MTEGVKVLEKDRQFLVLKALNSFSSRPSSFTVPIRGEGSTNPFFKLLVSPGKSVKVP